MERDFLGLKSSKNGARTVKDEAADCSKDSVPVRGSGMQWPFSNKVSAVPQLLSFKATQDDRPRKTILDPQASSGYMTISTADAFDSNQKPFSGVIQKNFIDKQAGNKHGMTAYSLQHSTFTQETRLFSVSNQSNQLSPVLQSNLASNGQNMLNSTIKPQPFGGVSLIAPVPLPQSRGSIVGTTDLRNSSKSCGTPSQLTIFYAGSVCVYDDISPEKAQAIMLLAGNESTPIQNKTVSTTQVQAPISRPSPVPSPLPLASHASSKPVGGSSGNNELAIMRPVASSASPINDLESPNAVTLVGYAAVKVVPPVGLPQARKASLACFLEKRKERVMSASPYHMSKKSPESSTPGSEGVSFSVNSCGSYPLPAIN